MLPAHTDIEYFLEIAELLNISRAAERLGITQPSLSMSLKRLEASLGTELVIRSKSGVQLTQAGAYFHQNGRSLLTEWETLRAGALKRVEEVSGRYSIGCHVSVAGYTLPTFLPRLLKRYPELEIRLEHDLSRKIVERVISHQIDFGIVVNPVSHPDLVLTALCHDRVTLWSSTGKHSDTLIYDPNLHQSQTLVQKLESKKIRFRRRITSASLEVIAELAHQGAGVAILPTRVATAAGYRLKLAGEQPPFFEDRVDLVYRADAQRSLASKAILTAIKASVK